MATNDNCTILQESLAWCQGTPVLPGVRRRLWYTSKANIITWPAYQKNAGNGQLQNAEYNTTNFKLKADTYWHFIDILPEKSQLTSDPQGEIPSQTQLNKLTAVHPGTGAEATAVAAYLNNADNVFIVQDMAGKWRVVGSRFYETKTTVTQDLGQGATGNANTTINVEATDLVPAPFYSGTIETEDGDLDLSNPDTVTPAST